MTTIERSPMTLTEEDAASFYGSLLEMGINKEIFESDSIDPFRLVADYHEAKYSDEKKAHFASVYRKTIECPDTALPAQL